MVIRRKVERERGREGEKERGRVTMRVCHNVSSLLRPKGHLRKRVGRFRQYLATRSESVIVVIGHSTFFMVRKCNS